jgi:hypothetical protein
VISGLASFFSTASNATTAAARPPEASPAGPSAGATRDEANGTMQLGELFSLLLRGAPQARVETDGEVSPPRGVTLGSPSAASGSVDAPAGSSASRVGVADSAESPSGRSASGPLGFGRLITIARRLARLGTLQSSVETPGTVAEQTLDEPRTDELLKSLDPDFRTRLERVIARMEKEFGNQIEVLETGRTAERQAELFAQGRTRSGPVVTWTLDSQHLDGRAADVRLNDTWNDPQAYSLLERIAREEGLRTLGAKDSGHIELPDSTTEQQVASKARGAVTKLARARSRNGVAGVARVARVATAARPNGRGLRATSSIGVDLPAHSPPLVPVAGSDGGSSRTVVPAIPKAPQPIPQPTHRPSEVVTETIARVFPEVMDGLDPADPGARRGTRTPAESSARVGEPDLQVATPKPPTSQPRAIRAELAGLQAIEATIAPVIDRARALRSGRAPREIDTAQSGRGESGAALSPELGLGADGGTKGLAGPTPTPGSDGLERVQKVIELQDQAPTSSRMDVRDLDGHGTRLRMRMIGNTLDARLDVQDSGTLQRMRDRVEQLHRSLEGQGIEVRNIDLRAGEGTRGRRPTSASVAGPESGPAGRGTERNTDQDGDARSPWRQGSQERNRHFREGQHQNKEGT